MGMIINHNIGSLIAQNNLSMTQTKYQTALERLSSGLRINRAADDAAGLGIGEKLTAQVNGLTQATSNAQAGISLIQTAEGALNETQSILQRMRELVVQAGTSTVGATDKTNIQSEISNLQSEITRISTTTNYNGTSLLTGGFGSAITASTVAAPATGASSFVSNGAAAATYTLATAVGTAGGTTTKFTLTSSVAGVNPQVIDNVATPTGTNVTSLNFSSLGISLGINSAMTANGASLTGATFTVTGSGGSFLVGANGTAAENIGVTVGDMSSAGLAVTSGAVDVTNAALTTQNMLASIDAAIQTTSAQRATLGAVQNRLSHTINSLNVAVQNTQSSESQIMDADVAKETTNLVSAQILVQAGTSVLSQANNAPQAAISLLPR
jgi:flagellin